MTYILSAPIGIFVGYNLKISDKDVLMIVLQSISAGAFVYIGACDLLVHAFHHDKSPTSRGNQFIKLLAFLAGAGIVLGMIVAANPALHTKEMLHAGHGESSSTGEADPHAGHDH